MKPSDKTYLHEKFLKLLKTIGEIKKEQEPLQVLPQVQKLVRTPDAASAERRLARIERRAKRKK